MAVFVFPFLVVVLVVFLFRFLAEWKVDGTMPSGWLDLGPSSVGAVVLVAILGLFSLGLVHLLTLRWLHWFNALAVVGVFSVLVFSLEVGPCGPLSGLFADVLVVALLFVLLAGRDIRAGPLGLLVERLWSFVAFDYPSLRRDWSGFVAALRCGLVLYMMLLLLFAIDEDIVPRDTLPFLLVFAGVGFSSAAAISDKRDMKAFASFAGMLVSMAGSYMQVESVLVDAWHLMVAALLVFLGPFVGLFSHVHPSVEFLGRISLGLAFLVVLFVAFLTPFLLLLGSC